MNWKKIEMVELSGKLKTSGVDFSKETMSKLWLKSRYETV